MRPRSWLSVGSLVAAAAWPLADLRLANPAPFGTYQPSLWFLAILIGLIALSAALAWPLRSFSWAAAVSAPLVMVFFSYPTVEPIMRMGLTATGYRHGAVIVFGFVLLAIAGTLLRSARGDQVRNFLLASPALALGTTILALLLTQISGARANAKTAAEGRNIQLAARPNVYHLLFDALGRPDTLALQLHIETRALPDLLRERGFIQAEDANALRLHTIESISSMLDPGEPSVGLKDLDASKSYAVKTFRGNGYSYGRYGEVFYFASCRGDEDLCLSDGRSGLSEFDVAMIARTPVYTLLRQRILGATTSRNFHANLERVAEAQLQAPFFVFSYMVPPHPPFIFSADCRSGEQDFNDFRAWRTSGIAKYGIAYRCVAQAAARTVDKIIARDPSAVIIISGDHGTSFFGGGSEDRTPKTRIGLEERVPAFLAVRGPTRCRKSFAAITRLDQLYPVLFRCLGKSLSSPADLPQTWR
jgi:hypothetical protein